MPAIDKSIVASAGPLDFCTCIARRMTQGLAIDLPAICADAYSAACRRLVEIVDCVAAETLINLAIVLQCALPRVGAFERGEQMPCIAQHLVLLGAPRIGLGNRKG